MSKLFRTEYNVTTGVTTIIEQTVYRNAEKNIIVLDSTDPVPDGYVEYDLGSPEPEEPETPTEP